MTEGVGPVLRIGGITQAIVEVLREVHPEGTFVDHGAYVRILVRSPCVLSAAAIEARTGEPFRIPVDLESVMVSFRGRLRISERDAVWEEGDRG